MKYLNNQQGSSAFVMILAIVIIAIIAVAGFRVLNKDTNPTSTEVTSSSSQVPDKITNKEDINKADSALDAESIDNTLDSAQLDADLNALY